MSLREAMPQKPPFRFVDEIVEVDETRIVGRYRFRGDEAFYAGHFPGNPITPGVILLETMCQVGLVAHGIHLLSLEVAPAEAARWVTLFTDAQVEFFRPVRPPETVTIRGERLFWRRKRLQSVVEMHGEDGALIARAKASGTGVRSE